MTSGRLRIMSETFKYQLSVQMAQTALLAMDPAQIASRTGYSYDPETRTVTGSMLGAIFKVRWAEQITLTRSMDDSGPWQDVIATEEGLVFLHHLETADGSALSGEWTAFRNLPEARDGYARSFEGRAVGPLLSRFGGDAAGFERAAEAIGGTRLEMSADVAFRIEAFPRFPMAILMWEGDDEFPPRGKIMFDKTAGHYLPTEDVAVISSLLVSRLRHFAQN